MKQDDKITHTFEGGFPRPIFHCSICGEATEGFSLCLKCNPQRYEVVGIEDSLPEALGATLNPRSLGIKDSLSGTAINVKYQAGKLISVEEAATNVANQLAEDSSLCRMIWNEAIEAAALTAKPNNEIIAREIRKLKK